MVLLNVILLGSARLRQTARRPARLEATHLGCASFTSSSFLVVASKQRESDFMYSTCGSNLIWV